MIPETIAKCISAPDSLPQILTCKFSILIFIHFFKNELREFDNRSKHFLFTDHFLNSHNHFSWQHKDIVRRSLLGLKGLNVANKIYIHQEHILLKNDSLDSHDGIDFTCCKTNQATESV